MAIDPFQTILDGLDKKVGVLERQSNSIKPEVDSFRNDALGFDPGDINSSATVNAAMAAWTPESIGAGVTDIAPINDFVEDCLADALAGISRYLKNILGNVEEGVDAVTDLAEKPLWQALQRIWTLVADINRLISALDIKISCVTNNDDLGDYTGQIEAIQDRIDTVIGDLYLADDGSFDVDTITTGINSQLADNMKAFTDRSTQLQEEIRTNVETTVNLPTTLNPRNRF
jgi:hypothetical protein